MCVNSNCGCTLRSLLFGNRCCSCGCGNTRNANGCGCNNCGCNDNWFNWCNGWSGGNGYTALSNNGCGCGNTRNTNGCGCNGNANGCNRCCNN